LNRGVNRGLAIAVGYQQRLYLATKLGVSVAQLPENLIPFFDRKVGGEQKETLYLLPVAHRYRREFPQPANQDRHREERKRNPDFGNYLCPTAQLSNSRLSHA
jgi:hypothetical protein